MFLDKKKLCKGLTKMQVLPFYGISPNSSVWKLDTMMWLAFFLEKGAESEGSQFRIFGLFEGNQQFKRDVLGAGGGGKPQAFSHSIWDFTFCPTSSNWSRVPCSEHSHRQSRHRLALPWLTVPLNGVGTVSTRVTTSHQATDAEEAGVYSALWGSGLEGSPQHGLNSLHPHKTYILWFKKFTHNLSQAVLRLYLDAESGTCVNTYLKLNGLSQYFNSLHSKRGFFFNNKETKYAVNKKLLFILKW